MVINENNSHINSFVKGMNADHAYDIVENSLYVFGLNVRITKNTLLGEDVNASAHEGVIAPVPFGKEFDKVHPWYIKNPTILAVKSINDIGIIITKHESNNSLCIYKFKIDENDNITYCNYGYITQYWNEEMTHKINIDKFTPYEDGEPTPDASRGEVAVVIGPYWCPWWMISISDKQKDFENIKQVSAVLYQELEGVIKLYIATGVYPIIEIRVDDETHYDVVSNQNVDYFINNRILPAYPVFIENKIDGSLKTSQVQYTYRYYNKFGTTTQLAPLTNKIQVIDANRNKEIGNAQDTETSIGFTLKIRKVRDYDHYNRIQIFRLLYIVPGEDAKVQLIYDGEVKEENGNFLFNDVGTTPLAELTMEEFGAMSGLVVIPKVIELNQQYLFASNVKDDTIIENITIENGNIDLNSNIPVILSTDVDGSPKQVQSFVKFTQSEANKYFLDRNINSDLVSPSYNNIFTSSLLRSLRRRESYYYGIVYYDKYGRRSNVIPIESNENPKGEIKTDVSNPLNNGYSYTNIVNTNLETNPFGVKITLPQPKIGNDYAKDIIGCLIVRRSSKSIYQNTLLQVALSIPVSQQLWPISVGGDEEAEGTDKESPLYPTGFLFTSPVIIHNSYYTYGGGLLNYIPTSTTSKQYGIYLIFSNEIDFRRDDILSKLNSSTTSLSSTTTYTINSGSYNDKARENINPTFGNNVGPFIDKVTEWIRIHNPVYQRWNTKSSQYMLFPLYKSTSAHDLITNKNIKSIKDVKFPQWMDGFTNILIDGSNILAGGIKKYQLFTTNIGNREYNNWISSANYDLKISRLDGQPNVNEDVSLFLAVQEAKGWRLQWALEQDEPTDSVKVKYGGLGYIGPGPSCFLVALEDTNFITTTDKNGYGTLVCNIRHDISKLDNEPDEYIQYFGFGNYFNLAQSEDGPYKVVHYDKNGNELSRDTEMIVYDGDIYVTPHEIVSMFKAYDFISVDTLPSMLVVNYIPLESKVNTFFDYGMNFLNTNSANLLLEPGSIDGITTQDRPLHQYNQIYSANDESNDVFSLVKEESENDFKQRTYYSEPKTNGEYVDNFVIFKPAAFIDVDSKYGEITNLLTDKNTLYYWQNTAFGKFSVNERSLINDLNGNTIMLGQAGILSRNDYISTKYGMRPYDFCAVSAEDGIYWIDINNTAVVAGSGNECINLGERLNVQNIINHRMSNEIPKIDYDLQNNELLCSCFNGDESLDQMVFNLKLKVATSIYTRDYDNIVNIKNSIYGIKVFNDDDIQFIKYNNLDKTSLKFLAPMLLSLLVNHSASTTKVFDSQQLIPAKRKEWNKENDQKTNKPAYTSFFEDAQISNVFETDINKTDNTIQPYTDREGNITYNIPRYGNDSWGNRLRGKWMKVDFDIKKPNEYTTISHVITKFRQSYS